MTSTIQKQDTDKYMHQNGSNIAIYNIKTDQHPMKIPHIIKMASPISSSDFIQNILLHLYSIY